MSTTSDFNQPEAQDHKAAMLGQLMPELFIVATATLVLIFGNRPWLHPETLEFAVASDAVTLMLSCTLIDVATRLQRAPPWWLGTFIIVGILLINGEVLSALATSWSVGMWVFLPFAWSILERFRALWTLPSASKLEKIRRRTLTFDRLYTGLMIGWLCVAIFIIHSLLSDNRLETDRMLPWLCVVFYGVSAFNIWRVHQPAFAKMPRSLFPRIDGDQATYLNPL